MRYWIFRCNPDLYDIDKRLEFSDPRTTWRVTRYRKEVSPGDLAFIWRGGTHRGICAAIEIDSCPQEMSELEHELPFCTKISTGRETKVQAHFLSWRGFIDEETILADSALADLSIFGFKQATNYRVTSDQGQRIQALMSRRTV
jgi:hypothetical protein